MVTCLKFTVFIFLGFLLPLASCRKEEGVGGRATIKGKLLAGNFHDSNVGVSECDFSADERVYIIYGEDDKFPDEDIRTGFDGSFEFRFLRKGKYKIYAYSLDTSLKSSQSMIPLIKEVEIKDTKETVEISDFIIYKESDDGGTSTVKGKLFARDYNSEFTEIKGEYYVADEYVFMTFGSGESYNIRYRTNVDGSFTFANLRKGKYQIYAFSKDSTLTLPSGILPVLVEVNITENNQVINLPDLVVIK